MNDRVLPVACLLACLFASVVTGSLIAEEAAKEAPKEHDIAPATSLIEARSRAKMLHEMIRGTLQIMHRDFFDEENIHAIPSSSLEDVFYEMDETYGVEIKWLIVNTDVLNVDHEAETDFEKFAAKKLAAGKLSVEKTDATRYHFAGPIRLGSQCLKCHVKRRTSNEPRTAGLVITMPIDLSATRIAEEP